MLELGINVIALLQFCCCIFFPQLQLLLAHLLVFLDQQWWD